MKLIFENVESLVAVRAEKETDRPAENSECLNPSTLENKPISKKRMCSISKVVTARCYSVVEFSAEPNL